MSPAHALLAQIGASDCERLDGGLLSQPVLAVTSLAYVAAGLAVALAGREGDAGRRRAALAYGATLALIGVGSVAFHGPQPSWARWAHDVPIAAALLFIACYDLAGRRAGGWGRWFAGGSALLAVLFAAAPGVAAPVTGLLVALAGAAEFAAVRAWRRRQWAGAGRGQLAVAGAVVALAGVAYAVGRTGSPLCDPDGLLQAHGLWHLLSAGVLAWWAWPAGIAGRTAGRVPAG